MSQFRCPNCGELLIVTLAGAPETSSLEDVKAMFPEDLEGLLRFEEKKDYFRVEPKQFLVADNFSKIASIVRGLNGEYVSAGKDSHFKIPK